ncbi:MAG TPA: Vms1/Ankzf1 family peptidyl-tRNA hydrolase [Acidimicrobiales bacterium]|nr:Vms1/Ankzf1 family peptidyl-tRNA hydrolase [Acidimicrobiales bacterium]
MHDLADLADLVARRGPFTSIYVNARSDRVDAADRLRIEWGNLRREAAAHGAPDAAIATIDELAATTHHGDAAAFAVIIDGDGGAHREALIDPIDHDVVDVDTLPRLGPIIEVRQGSIPHLLVVADRVGADLVAVAGGGETAAESVEGSEVDIHRGAPGGWSQRRFQQRAENRWEDNARGVAEEAARAARDIGARIVVVAGDERAVGFLREHLPADVAGLVVEVDGSRHDDLDGIADDAVRLVATEVAREVVERLEAFASARGRGDAVDGVTATLTALTERRVERLVIHDDPDDDRRAAISDDRSVVVDDPSDAADIGVDVDDARLVDAAMAAALVTGAAITIVPSAGRNAPAEGLGASLRGGGTTSAG